MSEEEIKSPVEEATDKVEAGKDEKEEVEKVEETKEEKEEEESKESKEEQMETEDKVEAEEEKEEEVKAAEPKEKAAVKGALQTTPKKERGAAEVPLYDQPLEMSGKRDRKKVERFVQETKKEEVKTEGAGTPLGDIPFVEAMITRMGPEELKVLHRVAFSRPGSGHEVKKNLRKFNGFPFTVDDKKFQNKQSTVEKIVMSELKKMLMILGLERSGNKGELVERLMAFMLDPQDMGKSAPKKKKRRGKKGRPRKMQEKKKQNDSQGDSPEGSDDSNSASGTDNSEEEEEEEEEKPEEKPKKTPKRTPAAKKTPGKRAAPAKKGAGAKRSRTSIDSDDSDSDDEPLAKKVKQPPSDGELKVMVKKILEGANLEEVTMKSVCRQVFDSYPDFDLTHKKLFIKETVKSIIS